MNDRPEVTVTLRRLDEQIAWYGGKSAWHQRWYKTLKTLQIVAAAVIPIASLVVPASDLALVAAGLGSLIVVLEGVQSLNQFHHRWVTYRSTCEQLKHEKYLTERKGRAVFRRPRPLAGGTDRGPDLPRTLALG